jgi:hypothetical protein
MNCNQNLFSYLLARSFPQGYIIINKQNRKYVDRFKMVFVYQVFGNYYKDKIEMLQISEQKRSMIDEIQGITSRYLLSKLDDEVASAMYVCKDKETAEKVQKVFREIMDEYDDDIGFTTEFIFELIDSAKY